MVKLLDTPYFSPCLIIPLFMHSISFPVNTKEAEYLFLQCIQGLPEGALRRIILTASGGAFR